MTLPAALDADLDTAARMFQGSAEDRRIWAAIAWRVGVEAFHFALMDKLAEDAADGPARTRSASGPYHFGHAARAPQRQRRRQQNAGTSRS